MKTPLKALYIRRSRENKDEDTLATMRDKLVRLCEQNGWKFDLYEDIQSGEKYEERVELNRMLSNIDQYDAIVCDAVDRLGRDDEENSKIRKQLWLHDVKVITPNKTYDFEESADEFMFGLESMFAKWELKKTKGRLKSGKVERFRSGQYSVGKPPLGYRIDPTTKTLKVFEPEAEVVRYIFDLSATGHGWRTISDKLQERGYRTQTGRVFPLSHISSILKNRVYVGETSMQVKDKRGNVSEVITGTCPPIIDLSTFLKARSEAERRNLNKNHTRRRVKSCLQGLFKCAKCGQRMRVIESQGYTHLGSCHNIINGVRCQNGGVKMEVLEEAVIVHLQSYRGELLESLKELHDKSTEDVKQSLERDLTAFKERLQVIDKDLDRLVDFALDGLISKDRMRQRKDKLEDEAKILTLKIRDTEHRLNELSTQTHEERIQTQIAKIDHFRDMDIESQNTFLKHIIDRIVYERPPIPKGTGRKAEGTLTDYPPKIEIHWRE